MSASKCEAATVRVAEILRTATEAPERNGIEDRTAADVLREKGFSPERIQKWFGYVPTPMSADPPRVLREDATDDHDMAAPSSFAR